MKYALNKMNEIIKKNEAHEFSWVRDHLNLLSSDIHGFILGGLRDSGYSIETTLNTVTKNERTVHFYLDDTKFSISVKYEGE